MKRQLPLKPLREQLKDFVHLHTGERRGNAVLLVILVSLSIWVALRNWVFQPSLPDTTALREEMERWVSERAAAIDADTLLKEPFPFDPNSIERADWKALGFTDRQVDGIERYLNKGGRFRVKRDLAKMYSILPGQYERLEPYILLPDSLPPRAKRERYPTERKEWPSNQPRTEFPRSERSPFRKLEVNTADSLQLVALPGIGPSFAKGILKYRDGLGGFHSLEQLEEVYVLKDKPDALVRLKELLVVDTLAIRRIPINTCTVEELAAHPYVRWKLAKPLIAYRQHHGPFKSREDIMGCVLIDEAVFRKLAPYLSLE
ncbi:MAG: helix-hairpin-helix domain-containing protein [Flavobacteriales bacterium]|nr:helix-hairpin-helix domain-containing protein [Flavobacteriales bacterium]